MATLNILALTTSTGQSINIDTNKVVYAYDNGSSEAVLTYENNQGYNKVVTLTVSTATLQGYSTGILFIKALTNGTSYCFNNARVVKLFVNGSTCDMYYNIGRDAVNAKYTINDTAANVSSACGLTIPVTDSAQNLLYYINKQNVGNIISASEAGRVLGSAVVATAGTLMVAGSTTLTLTGGTYGVQATATVVTTKVVSKTIVAAGTLYLAGDILTVSTGAGTYATIHVDTVNGGTGAITGATLLTAGAYTTNPTLTAGATTTNSVAGSGATVTVVMGANTVTPLNAGQYSALPSNPVSTTGGGNDATLTATFIEGTISGSKILYDDKQNSAFKTLNVQETPAELVSAIG